MAKTIDALANTQWPASNRKTPRGKALIYHEIPGREPKFFVYRMVLAKDTGSQASEFFCRGSPAANLRAEFTRAYDGQYDIVNVVSISGNTDDERDTAMDAIATAYCNLCKAYWQAERAKPVPVPSKKSVPAK